MNRPRLAITTVLVLLAIGATAGPAVGATSRLVPSVPWLSHAAPAPTRPAPAAPAASPTTVPSPSPTVRPASLPNTGFPIAPELIVAGILLCGGAAIRAGSRRRGIVRLEPAVAGRR